jgi:RHS repeat-associated protein
VSICNYYGFEQEIFGEMSPVGRLDYFPDAMHSVTLVVNAGLESKGYYTPYGRGNAPGGASFGWIGSLGYRPSYVSETLYYVRSRHVSPQRAVWISKDVLWPATDAYVYAKGNPVSFVDPSGLQPVGLGSGLGQSSSSNGLPPGVTCPAGNPPSTGLCSPQMNAWIYAYCNCCYAGQGDWDCRTTCDQMASLYYDRCHSKPPRGGGIFAPPPGGGEIAPRPSPAPMPLPKPVPQDHCFVAPDPCSVDWSGDCIRESTVTLTDGTITVSGIDLKKCNACCDRHYGSCSSGGYCKDRCYNLWYATSWGSVGETIFNGIAGTVGGGAGGAPVHY